MLIIDKNRKIMYGYAKAKDIKKYGLINASFGEEE